VFLARSRSSVSGGSDNRQVCQPFKRRQALDRTGHSRRCSRDAGEMLVMYLTPLLT
jgi:hypothetical protein